MISCGNNIRSTEENLQKVRVDYLYQCIRVPRTDVAEKIARLRIIKGLDAKMYATQKRELPFFVCGMFTPAFRRKENFAYTEYFVLDIDHVQEKGHDLGELKQRLVSDSRVVLCFISPGQDGLKLMFKLKSRCYDAGIYSIFYKLFASMFSKQYNLQQVIDDRTCDVSRACFMSIDPDVYYNPVAELVDWEQIVNEQNSMALFENVKQVEEEQHQLGKECEKDELVSNEPGAETMQRIKSFLNPARAKKEKIKEYFVPGILNDIIGDLKRYIEETGAIVTEIRDISYGKKIGVQVGLKFAEINLFYGKRGFNVVKSPKQGTSEELNAVVAELVTAFIEG
ncbi:MAG: CRISPR-associated primase-polymerase type B [Paludibacteraceae bacterium]|nr:CRISPR-associated primase-polymerase type B [Paludibacteraceae bacterium]